MIQRRYRLLRVFQYPRLINVQAFLGLTRYYRNFVQGHAKIVMPLFDLTKKDQSFLWIHAYQEVFDTLKLRLIEAPILVRLNFERSFIFDVD